MARDTQRHIVTGRAAIAIYNITSTLMDALRDELKEKFGDDLANNDALLEESVQLCTHHGLDADSFLWKWEAM
ncbi:hypothetical protein GGF50DRAFT_121601, partial [Schizophyllum commune]